MSEAKDHSADGATLPITRQYRYYDLVMVAFVTVFLCSNLIGPAKVVHLEVAVISAILYGNWSNELLLKVMAAHWCLKVLAEMLLSVTIHIVRWLKMAESEDYYDRNTNFTIFPLKT